MAREVFIAVAKGRVASGDNGLRIGGRNPCEQNSIAGTTRFCPFLTGLVLEPLAWDVARAKWLDVGGLLPIAS